MLCENLGTKGQTAEIVSGKATMDKIRNVSDGQWWEVKCSINANEGNIADMFLQREIQAQKRLRGSQKECG